MPKKKLNKKRILVFDAGYHSHMGYYNNLKEHYDLDFCVSIDRFFTLKSMSSFHYDAAIIYPHMYKGNNSYKGIDLNGIPESQTGQEIYRRFFEQKRKHTKVIVWAHSVEAALEHWGESVKRRLIIPAYSHFDFLPVVHGIMNEENN